MTEPERFTLANRDHLEVFVGLLLLGGALCPKCGHGTRAAGQKWRKCKQCGERVPRRDLETLTAEER
jgi:tRNA(Ile2) C34 agmatinyltransferase TiaS